MSRPVLGRVFYRRFWLNRPGFHSTAYIMSEIELRDDGEAGGLELIASFRLADCRRSATLDFDVYANSSAADRKNTLRKARRFRKSVNAFCDALEAAAKVQKKARRSR